MPVKHLCIPVSTLDKPEKVSFFEFCIEPAGFFENPGNALQELRQLGLVQAVQAAYRAWDILATPAVRVYALSLNLHITNSTGAALGLALCPFLAIQKQPWQLSFVMGSLQFKDSDADIGAVAHLPSKLAAIRAQGKPHTPTLLLFADDGHAETRREIEALIDLGFCVRPVRTLSEAKRVCLSEPEIT